MRLANILRSKKSVLFINPDYHSTFFLRSELRKLGWKADIYVPWNYPVKLLYSVEDIKRPGKISTSLTSIDYFVNWMFGLLWFFSNFWKYSFHVYYGRPPAWSLISNFLSTNIKFLRKIDLSLALSNIFGCKLIYIPSGCHDEFLKSDFLTFDDGNVCNNCGFWDRCNDKENLRRLFLVNKYFEFGIGHDPWPTKHYFNIHFKRKCIDLDLWSPGINIPIEFEIRKNKNLIILHSFSLSTRSYLGRNIKGSPYIAQAINRLRDEGHKVELVSITDVSSAEMRFYQAQADIVVEQLIYGWWGSTGVEAMALGKPVVCYLRPSWKMFFLETFPEYSELPIIEANVNNIYDVLLNLIIDKKARIVAGDKSRNFAQQHFNPKINAKEFEKVILNTL